MLGAYRPNDTIRQPVMNLQGMLDYARNQPWQSRDAAQQRQQQSWNMMNLQNQVAYPQQQYPQQQYQQPAYEQNQYQQQQYPQQQTPQGNYGNNFYDR